ncbi:hypothetical protein [Desulfosporosinus burensis]
MLMQQYLEQYLNGISWRPQSIAERQYIEKIKHALAEQQRKFYARILNPLNLSPLSVTFWFPVIPSLAIGVSVANLGEVDIYIRQAMEPTFANIFSAFIILEFHVPPPFALLILASCLGLYLTGKINKLLETVKKLLTEQKERLQALEEELDFLSTQACLDLEEKILETIAEEKHRSSIEALNPFQLAPISMSIFFPVFKDHTAIGIVFHDLDYLAIAILQAIEPNDKMYSIFRFIHAQVPFSLTLLVMFLAIHLFLSDEINKIEQGAREGSY